MKYEISFALVTLDCIVSTKRRGNTDKNVRTEIERYYSVIVINSFSLLTTDALFLEIGFS